MCTKGFSLLGRGDKDVFEVESLSEFSFFFFCLHHKHGESSFFMAPAKDPRGCKRSIDDVIDRVESSGLVWRY